MAWTSAPEANFRRDLLYGQEEGAGREVDEQCAECLSSLGGASRGDVYESDCPRAPDAPYWAI